MGRYVSHSDINEDETEELGEPEELLLDFVETLQNPKPT